MKQNLKGLSRGLFVGFLVAGMIIPGVAAEAEGGCGGGGGPGPSTPGLKVHVTQATSASVNMTAVGRVDDRGDPVAKLVLFDRQGLVDGGLRIHDFEAHRIALMSDHETDNLVGDEDHTGLRATIRGAGLLDDGTEVQVWIDVEDNGPRANTDRARVRIRPLTHHSTAETGSVHDDGDCGGGGGNGQWDYAWMTVRQVQVTTGKALQH